MEEAERLIAEDEEDNSWNYAQNGRDWAINFPQCGMPFQSPINLLSPVTDYGQSYRMYSIAEDNPLLVYEDFPSTQIKFSRRRKQIAFNIDSFHVYAGFRGYVGRDVFGTAHTWDSIEIVFHSPAEHLVDGKRHDFEM